jgi:hypothetical protein
MHASHSELYCEYADVWCHIVTHCTEKALAMLRLVAVSKRLYVQITPALCSWLKDVVDPIPRHVPDEWLWHDKLPPLAKALAWSTGDWSHLRQLQRDITHLIKKPLSQQDASEIVFIVALAEFLETLPIFQGRERIQVRRDRYMKITARQPFKQFKKYFRDRLYPLPRQSDIMRYWHDW